MFHPHNARSDRYPVLRELTTDGPHVSHEVTPFCQVNDDRVCETAWHIHAGPIRRAFHGGDLEMANVVACQNCQGNGTVQVNKIVKGKSVWTTETCRACGGSGKVNKKLI